MNQLFRVGQFLVLFIGFLITSLACNSEKKVDSVKASERLVPVRTIKLELQDFTEYGEYLGSLEGAEQAMLVSFNGGRVAKVLGREGQKVKVGERLCDIEGARNTVKLESARLAEHIASTTLQRRKVAQASGAASQLNADQAQADYLKAVEMRIQTALEHDGAYCISPISGTVVERLITVWQFLPPMSKTFLVANLDRMKIKFGIPENDISGYSLGSKIVLSSQSMPSQTWEGEITSLAKSVNENSRTFLAEAKVDNKTGTLLPGLSARIRVERNLYKSKLVIPASSILTAGKEQFVYIVENGAAKKRVVEILTADKNQAVISSGLDSGNELIISGQLLAGDGARVESLTK